jgi:UDP-N-acetylmuramoyl-L-alanyl-D-glutamate--2,6-diaminopimelate ligase
MKLRELFSHLNLDNSLGKLEVRGISRDSRLVEDGDLFFIMPGESFDVFSILKSIKKRVTAFVGKLEDKEIISSIIKDKPVIYVEDIDQELGRVADLFYKFYNHHFKFIGVTGTCGKTTTTYLIYEILKEFGVSTSLIGTINYYLNDKKIKSLYTTPDYLLLRKLFSSMKNNEYVVMEVSSHAIDQERIRGIDFSYCVFTNLSRDHLDYHKSMKEYFAVKKRLFFLNPDALSFINIDCPYGARLARQLKNKKITYAIKKEASLRATGLKTSPQGTEFTLLYEGREFKSKTPLLGRHNILNVLAAVSVVSKLGFDLREIIGFLPYINPPEGRLQRLGYDIFVDYAHTPVSLKNALLTLRSIGYKRVICVFGCGGDRDKGKRRIMGRVASRYADFSFITSDNPRSEDPIKICFQIEKGFTSKNYSIIVDRYQAIKAAIRMKRGRRSCAILVAGKGHEDYQIVRETKIPFKDQEVIANLIK